MKANWILDLCKAFTFTNTSCGVQQAESLWITTGDPLVLWAEPVTRKWELHNVKNDSSLQRKSERIKVEFASCAAPLSSIRVDVPVPVAPWKQDPPNEGQTMRTYCVLQEEAGTTTSSSRVCQIRQGKTQIYGTLNFSYIAIKHT